MPELNTARRFRMLDLLRGVTVLVMVLSHSVYFFHNDSNFLLVTLEKFGNTVSFITFLLISAATAQIAYFNQKENFLERSRRLLKRIRVLALGYFVVAFLVFFGQIYSTHGFDKLKLIFDIATLRNLAPFTEFFVPFFLFPLILVTFPNFFRRIVKSVPLSIVFGLLIYFLGMFIYRIPFWEPLAPWKALLVGSQGFYRFPLFQYFPIYLLGLCWGYWLPKLKNIKHQKELAEAFLGVALSGIVLGVITSALMGRSLDAFLRRWPPSLPFLFAGIAFAAFLSLVFYSTKQLKKRGLVRDFLLVLGQNALGIALTHVFLLQIYSLSGGLKTGSVVIYLLSFIILLILSIALAALIPFNFRFALTLHRGNYNEQDLEENPVVELEEDLALDVQEEVEKIERYFFFGPRRKNASKRLIKHRHILAASILMALATLIAFPPIVSDYQTRVQAEKGVDWWSAEYGYRQNLTIKNIETLTEIPENGVVEYSLNHSALVSAKKSYPDGRDLKILYWTGRNYSPLRFWLKNEPNLASTTLAFELPQRVKPGDETSAVYLYYGNNLAGSSSEKEKPVPAVTTKYSIIEAGEESYPHLLSAERRWNLTPESSLKLPKTLHLTLKTKAEASEVNYEILNQKVSGNMEQTGQGVWEGVIPLSKLKPGSYQVQAKIKTESENILSGKYAFFVSEPFYVAWTEDWEGYDVSEVYLSAIAQIAHDHGLKLTHLWNPRINLAGAIPADRAERLTEWVKERRDEFGEQIGMHLHMFTDFVKAAGVEPKNSPNWGDSGDGYGALTTNYNEAELTKILKKGIELMRVNGLGTPTIYRAGGWFANAETLRAIQATGFLADSSGRTAYKFFAQKGPWSLSEIAQPYHPSTTDANSSAMPALSLLEIPNNGADSYWFSSTVMINRFYANYSGGTLAEPKQITYLSHPHWFNKAEQQKIEDVFAVIDKYKYDNDAGPAVYATLDEIYKAWEEK